MLELAALFEVLRIEGFAFARGGSRIADESNVAEVDEGGQMKDPIDGDHHVFDERVESGHCGIMIVSRGRGQLEGVPMP
jgi:hypothetical protein